MAVVVKDEILLRDFEIRRNDILQRIQRIEADMRNGMLVTGGLWAWIITHIQQDLVRFYVIWIPLAFVIFSYIKYFAQDGAIRISAAYLVQLEQNFGLDQGGSPLAWEHFLRAREQDHRLMRGLLQHHNNLFWLALILINGAGALYFSPAFIGMS
ncbi:MAG: hypothetical protein SV765_13345 [Pseudomonadota bacterium]|nr:hypothetical protein [Pseudomonadota bacterium]